MEKPLQLKLLAHWIELIAAAEGYLDDMCIVVAFLSFYLDLSDLL